jgi:hypothetical protein
MKDQKIIVAVTAVAAAVALWRWLHRKKSDLDFLGSWSITPESGSGSAKNTSSTWGKLRKAIKTHPVFTLHPEVQYGGKALPGFHFANGASSRVIAEIDLGAISHNVSHICLAHKCRLSITCSSCCAPAPL